jgi:hypothetical protein
MASPKTVCFVANYTKTYLFDAVAKVLGAQGITVCWIAVNRKIRDYLTAQYGADAVLYLCRENAQQPGQPVGDFRLNELVHGDRTLCHQPPLAYDFLNNIQQPIHQFLKRHGVRLVLGEVTWAHEILIHRMVNACPDLNSEYYCPHTIRMPAGRFGFFRDEYQSVLVPVPATADAAPCDASSCIAVEKPDYLWLNDLRLQQARTWRARLSRLKRYFTMENIDPADPTLIANRWTLLKLRAAEEINRETYRVVPKAKFDDALAKRDYAFLALHKQPEASVDVIGRYYEDQYANILNVWRALPDGWLLLVKEHSNAIGDRSWWFYHKLRRLRNLVLVDETADSHEVIQRSRMVITVSGTVAYEAALMGVPSFTFAEVFFNRLPGCRKIGLEHLRAGGLGRAFQANDHQDTAPFTEWLYRHSAEGIISDPISNPSCMSARNITRVADALMALIR